MASPNDETFEDDEFDEEMERHYNALRKFVLEYIEDEDVPDDVFAALLVDLAIELRKVAYVLGTEKPSVGGLKLDLDRYRSDIDGVLRMHKKEAEPFLDGMRAAMAEAEAEIDDDDDDDEDDEDEDDEDDLDDEDADEEVDDETGERGDKARRGATPAAKATAGIVAGDDPAADPEPGEKGAAGAEGAGEGEKTAGPACDATPPSRGKKKGG